MSTLFHVIITNVGADLRVCPENYCFTIKGEHHIKEGEHTRRADARRSRQVRPYRISATSAIKTYELLGIERITK